MRIITPGDEHVDVLTELAIKTVVESHGRSAPREDFDEYIASTMTPELIAAELADPKFIFRLAYVDRVAAGYSKITPNAPREPIGFANVCKMDRLYIASEFYDQKLGKTLFDLNVQIAKDRGQRGMWLYVWKENERAKKFYRRQGFTEVDEAYFKISERHSNPNHVMLLEF